MAYLNGVEPKPAPDLDIPTSRSTVTVRIIDTTTRIGNIDVSAFIEPKVGAYTTLNVPAYSFLVENEAKGEKVLFDLGVPPDWKTKLAGPIVDMITSLNWTVTTEKNVSDILQEHGISLGDINAVIWSHSHFDHVGDPSTFPSSTTLVVGPGFQDFFLPGWPSNPESRVHEGAWQGRELREINLVKEGNGLKLGEFNAYDYFGDGSFYLLDSPGHLVAHICALARTTADPPTFIFMGGDAAHHGGEFRPTEYVPLPKDVKPDPRQVLAEALQTETGCPGEIFSRLHPQKEHAATQPFFQPSSGGDVEECKRSIRKMEQFDANENVLCIMAHDSALLEVLDFFPKSANEWTDRGWKALGRWRFLGDLLTEEERGKQTL